MDTLTRYQALLAPGTPLREGLDRIVSGHTGALVVLGTNAAVERAATGGFTIDVDFTPTALRELAKMDGGIVVSADLSRILSAGVQFMPDPSLPTLETGTRHRTADRMSQAAKLPVVTVSSSMSTIALYLEGMRHVVERPDVVFTRGNNALNTLATYGSRLRQLTDQLSALEVADQVTVRDVVLVAQRRELVGRLAGQVSTYVRLLGADGHLLGMQLAELTSGLHDLATHLDLDYRPDDETALHLDVLTTLSDDALIDVAQVAKTLGIGQPDDRVQPRGFRQLYAIDRLPASLAPRLVEHFGGLQGILGATRAELTEVDGVGDLRARVIRDGLVRLSDAAYHHLT